MESIQKQFYNDKDLNKGNYETKNKGYLKKFFNSFSNILFNDNLNSQFGTQPLNFVCIICGNEHNERTCPKCGSNAVKLG